MKGGMMIVEGAAASNAAAYDYLARCREDRAAARVALVAVALGGLGAMAITALCLRGCAEADAASVYTGNWRRGIYADECADWHEDAEGRLMFGRLRVDLGVEPKRAYHDTEAPLSTLNGVGPETASESPVAGGAPRGYACRGEERGGVSPRFPAPCAAFQGVGIQEVR